MTRIKIIDALADHAAAGIQAAIFLVPRADERGVHSSASDSERRASAAAVVIGSMPATEASSAVVG